MNLNRKDPDPVRTMLVGIKSKIRQKAESDARNEAQKMARDEVMRQTLMEAERVIGETLEKIAAVLQPEGLVLVQPPSGPRVLQWKGTTLTFEVTTSGVEIRVDPPNSGVEATLEVDPSGKLRGKPTLPGTGYRTLEETLARVIERFLLA